MRAGNWDFLKKRFRKMAIERAVEIREIDEKLTKDLIEQSEVNHGDFDEGD